MYSERMTRTGQCLIETALIFPILIMITLGIIEFARFFWTSNAVSNASREAARMAVVTPDLTADDQRVIDAVQKHLGYALISADGIQVGNCDARRRGDTVLVTVSLPYKWLTPLPNFLPGDKQPPVIRREAAMTYEGIPGELF